ncbi:MAG: tetratricopeptide repeat protein [Candidatus Latescibacter sp.]|nr:tetratricopeptide repeat protein [Candidatus Latescibacter sp.]
MCIILLSVFSLSAFSQAVDPDFIKAQVLESQGKNEEALAVYSRLYSANKTDIYFFKLVMLCEKIGDFKTMGESAGARLGVHPGDIFAINYLARSLYGQGKDSEGRRLILDSIGNNWKDPEKIRNAANEFMSRNDLGTALSIYLTAREKSGGEDLYSLELAQIYRVQMNYSQALREYLKTLDSQPVWYSSIDLLLNAALDDRADPQSLLAPLAQYLKAKPGSIQAARLISGLKYRLGDYEGAYRSLLDAAVPANNPVELWNIAERLSAEGHPREAILAYADFYRYFKTGPNGTASLLKCAALREKSGDREGARRDYLTLSGDFPGTVEASLASLRILKLSAPEDGAEIISRLRAFVAAPLDRSVAFEANLLLGQAFLRQGKTAEAEKSLNETRLKARSKNEVYAVTSTIALMHFFTGAYETMAQDIEACVAGFPDHENANDLLALRVLSLRCSTAKERMNITAYAHGRYALFRGLDREGVDSLTVAAGDTSSAAAPEAAHVLGDYFSERGDTSKALTWYNRAISAARDTTVHVGAMMNLAELYVTAFKDNDAARKLYMDALTAFPGSVYEAELRSRLRSLTEKKVIK